MLWILDEVDGVIVGPASACDGKRAGKPLRQAAAPPACRESTFARERDASITMGSHRDAQIHLGEMFRLFDPAVRPPAAKKFISQSAGSAARMLGDARHGRGQPPSLPAAECLRGRTEALAAEEKRLTD
jgi:hypothetical protein